MAVQHLRKHIGTSSLKSDDAVSSGGDKAEHRHVSGGHAMPGRLATQRGDGPAAEVEHHSPLVRSGSQPRALIPPSPLSIPMPSLWPLASGLLGTLTEEGSRGLDSVATPAGLMGTQLPDQTISLEIARGTLLVPLRRLSHAQSSPSVPGSLVGPPHPAAPNEPPPTTGAREQEQQFLRREEAIYKPESEHGLADNVLNQDLLESVVLYLAFPLMAAFGVVVREATG